jgi:diguanylate cyclase (GGDEF)-like protein/hemerythrin-like metal-binding protein
MDYVNRTPGSHLSLVLVDIDHFKTVNDTWGHPIGDDVLERVSRLLASGVRRHDTVSRVGGEEFILLLPKTSMEQARIHAERLRLELAMTRMPIVGTITASFGVAEMEPKESFRSLYNRVDNAMYKAKDNGRNQVAVVEYDEIGVIAEAHRYFAWRKEWESGHPVIDGEHRQLIDHCNKLAQALQVGGEWSKTFDVLAEIYALTDAHFSSEEKILRQSGYHDVEKHARIHRAILTTARRLIDEFAAGTAKPSVLVSFLIDDFIIGHMLEEDVKYFPHIVETRDAEKHAATAP